MGICNSSRTRNKKGKICCLRRSSNDASGSSNNNKRGLDNNARPKPTTSAQPQKAAKPTGSTAPQKAASPKTSPTASPTDAAPESFVQAVRTAIAASKATQTAKSADEWNAVATQWQEALDLMKAVPKSNRNYAVAQKRVETYQINLKYAQQKAASAAEQK